MTNSSSENNEERTGSIVEKIPNKQVKPNMTTEISMTYIREERRIMRKVISYEFDSSTNESSPHLSSSEDQHTNVINILFVHGSCGASIQYEALISSLGLEFFNSCDKIDTKTIVNFHMYDALGCGESKHDGYDWGAFSEPELAKDLECVFLSMTEDSESRSVKLGISRKRNKKNFLVAHSYGTSQVIQLANTVNSGDIIDGIVLIGGALIDGPCKVVMDGGLPVFRLPIFVLKLMQPFMTNAFINAAYFQESKQSLKDTARNFSNNNNMAMVKAFYRQTKWSGVNDAQALKTKALIIHGEEDKIIPVEAGKHLSQCIPNSEFVAIPNSSHQVFEEFPYQVAQHIHKFIMNDF